MSTWNDALAAYDDECPAIEEVREEYGRYLRSIFGAISKRVAERLGPEWEGKIEGEGPRTQWSAAPRSVGMKAWTPRAWGGPPRTLTIGVRLDVRAGFSRKLFLDAAEKKLRPLPGAAPDPANLGEVEEIVVRVATATLGDDTASQLVEHVNSFVELVEVLDASTTKCEWMRAVLDGIPALGVPVTSTAWYKNKCDKWAGGFYIQLDRNPEHQAWVCARPPGELILGYSGEKELDERLREKLGVSPVAIEGEEESFLSLLATPETMVELYERRDTDGLRARVLEGLSAYFHLVT